jgi:hypothetical protein
MDLSGSDDSVAKVYQSPGVHPGGKTPAVFVLSVYQCHTFAPLMGG